MNALFRWLDVDRVQWRALLGAALRTDLDALRRGEGTKKASSSAMALMFLIYLLAGIAPAVIAATAGDVLLSATVMVTMLVFMVVTSLLVGEGATILSPNDHHVLGFRPVTSRTYLAVRVSSLLVRTAIISTCVALAPVVVFLTNGGFNPARGVAALVAAYGTGLAATLAVVAMYGWLLRLAGPARMVRYASYTQFTAQLIVWGGFFIVTQDLVRQQIAGLSLSGSAWALLYPGAWFGSWVELATDARTAWTLVPASLSLLLILALWRSIGGKLSLGYADSLGRLAAGAASPRAHGERRPGPWQPLLDDESRAMAILVRSHMQHDMKFRLGVISLIPITLLYLFMGGWPGDPFADDVRRSGDAPLIQMALLFLPVTLRRVLVTSERWRASWVFRSAPADHAKLVLAARNIIAIFFLLPYLIFIAAIFAYSFGSLWHALLHTLFMGMVSYLALQFVIWASPELPFSLPIEKDAQTGAMFGALMVVFIVGIIAYYLLTALVYRSAIAMLVVAVAFGVLAWIMDRLTRQRVRSPAWALTSPDS